MNFTTRDIAEHWLKGDSQNQRSYKDIYILEDGECTSSVVVVVVVLVSSIGGSSSIG